MFVFRSIEEPDEKEFIELAFIARTGITSLPKDKRLLMEKVQNSLRAYSSTITAPNDELYLFVLEDITQKKILGTSGIYASTGIDVPTYYYQLQMEAPHKSYIEKHTLQPRQILKLISYTRGPSELCSLFLRPDCRGEGLGKLLSLARLLFIASHRMRFNDILIANLRGVIDLNGKSPLWEAIGRKFLDIEFEELQELIPRDTSIASSILPEKAIYTALLSKKAQSAMGRPHDNSYPAKLMLMNQGFEFTSEIDPFDGGPKLKALLTNVPAISNSYIDKIDEIVKNIETDDLFILCNNELKFRACYGKLLKSHHHKISIDEICSKILQVGVGDEIRYYKVN